MKIEAFKKLIKESIREVLKEEGILNSNLNENKMHFTTQRVDPSKYISQNPFPSTPYHTGPQITSTGDPLKDIMMQTMMSADDLSNFQ